MTYRAFLGCFFLNKLSNGIFHRARVATGLRCSCTGRRLTKGLGCAKVTQQRPRTFCTLTTWRGRLKGLNIDRLELQPWMGFSCYDFYTNEKVMIGWFRKIWTVTAAKALSLMSSNALNIKDKDYRQLLFNWSTTSYLTYSALYHFMLANPIDPIV